MLLGQSVPTCLAAMDMKTCLTYTSYLVTLLEAIGVFLAVFSLPQQERALMQTLPEYTGYLLTVQLPEFWGPVHVVVPDWCKEFDKNEEAVSGSARLISVSQVDGAPGGQISKCCCTHKLKNRAVVPNPKPQTLNQKTRSTWMTRRMTSNGTRKSQARARRIPIRSPASVPAPDCTKLERFRV